MRFHTKPSAEGFEIFLGCAAPLFTSVLKMFSRLSGNLGLELSRGAVEFLKFLCEFFRETLLKVRERSRVQFPRWDEWCYSEKKEGKKNTHHEEARTDFQGYGRWQPDRIHSRYAQTTLINNWALNTRVFKRSCAALRYHFVPVFRNRHPSS